MASPHTAGAAALMLEAHPGMSVGAIRAALQNTADPALWSGNPATGLFEPVHRQGAGMIDIDDAIEATTSITPSKLALGESQAGRANSGVDDPEHVVVARDVRPVERQCGRDEEHLPDARIPAAVAVGLVQPGGSTGHLGDRDCCRIGHCRRDDHSVGRLRTADKTVYGGYITLTAGTTEVPRSVRRVRRRLPVAEDPGRGMPRASSPRSAGRPASSRRPTSPWCTRRSRLARRSP